MNREWVAQARGADSAFLRMLDVMLPHGGCALVQVEAYFDESGSHDGSPVLCVAGYLIEATEAAGLTREWQAVLNARHLPYFRMSECAHGNGAFARLARSERIQVQTRMIQITKEYTIMGLCVTVNDVEFRGHFPSFTGNPYTFCINALLGGVRKWLKDHQWASRVAYFFEAGHRSQAEANAVMTQIFREESKKAEHKYGGHAFIESKRQL